jgi:putative tricarboxylic transport membrane protein|tara:strand:- start:1697 stop:2740 length:1044 start_codon:yes stop_codon:yes gene_type:complete
MFVDTNLYFMFTNIFNKERETMKLFKTLISVLFSAVLLFSTTNSFAIDKLHFVIGGGAGGGWDGTARGTGEALTKAGFLQSASFENMSGGGGGKALAYMINTKPSDTILVQSTPLVLRSITRHDGYVKDGGSGVISYKDVVPIAGVIGDYGAIAVAKDSPYQNFKDVVDAYNSDPKSVKMAGGSVRGSMDHLIGALAFQQAGADPNSVIYVPYDAGGKALAGLLSGETQILSTGLGEVMGARDQVRIIGITAPDRVSDAPEVPTLKEQGFDVQFVNWRGFFGPPGMSNSMKHEIAVMLGEVQKTPEWEEVRKRNAWVNIYNPDKKFISFLEKQTEEMTALMKKLGVI